MSLIVKRLTPELAEDYFDFFDNRAFSDNSPYYPCYCNAFNMSAERIRSEIIEQVDINGGGTEGWKRSLRKSAQNMVERGEILGYLVYDHGISVVCFEIAPEYRGKGIATALLRRVCEDALKDGYEYVEAYPALKGKGEYDFTGPVKLYEKLGFTIREQHGEMLIMRKDL